MDVGTELRAVTLSLILSFNAGVRFSHQPFKRALNLKLDWDLNVINAYFYLFNVRICCLYDETPH